MSQLSALPSSTIRRINVDGSSASAVKGLLTTSTANRLCRPDFSASRAGRVRARRFATTVGASGSARRTTTVTTCDDACMTASFSLSVPATANAHRMPPAWRRPCDDTLAPAGRYGRSGRISVVLPVRGLLSVAG